MKNSKKKNTTLETLDKGNKKLLEVATKNHPDFITNNINGFTQHPRETILAMLKNHYRLSPTPDCPDYDPNYPRRNFDFELAVEYDISDKEIEKIAQYILDFYKDNICAAKEYNIPLEFALLGTNNNDWCYLKKAWDGRSNSDFEGIIVRDEEDLYDTDFLAKALEDLAGERMPATLYEKIEETSCTLYEVVISRCNPIFVNWGY